MCCSSFLPFRPSPLPAEIVDVEAQTEELISWESESYAVSFYGFLLMYLTVWVLCHWMKSTEDANDAEMKGQDSDGEDGNSEEKNGKDDSGVDHLSVMYMPCQDPLLVKIY